MNFYFEFFNIHISHLTLHSMVNMALKRNHKNISNKTIVFMEFWWSLDVLFGSIDCDYTHFLKFEYLDYDNVKPFKSKFSINSNLESKTCFFIWYWSALHVCDSWNHAINPFKMQHMSEISKLIFLTYFESTFSQEDNMVNFTK